MNTETATTTPANDLKKQVPLRTYEITFASGRRQRVRATRVSMPRTEALARSTGMVEFYAPIDPDGDTGWCGRLVLAAHLGTVVMEIRDVDADITTARSTKAPFGRRLLDALTWHW